VQRWYVSAGILGAWLRWTNGVVEDALTSVVYAGRRLVTGHFFGGGSHPTGDSLSQRCQQRPQKEMADMIDRIFDG
jgi:hypothetical protein